MVSRDDTPGFTDSLYLNIVVLPSTADAGKDRWVCQGDTITFDGSGGGDGNYTLDWELFRNESGDSGPPKRIFSPDCN
ncbi:MAG: hypothetical protein R2769_03915 [Saprospiraceae bacterium]